MMQCGNGYGTVITLFFNFAHASFEDESFSDEMGAWRISGFLFPHKGVRP
jgi:hypothetical protein